MGIYAMMIEQLDNLIHGGADVSRVYNLLMMTGIYRNPRPGDSPGLVCIRTPGPSTRQDDPPSSEEALIARIAELEAEEEKREALLARALDVIEYHMNNGNYRCLGCGGLLSDGHLGGCEIDAIRREAGRDV